jgi:outer membrane biosynthesis protein TonB
MTDRQYGILGTVLAHGVLLALLLLSFLHLPEPVKDLGGILINFGDVEAAGGPTEPALSDDQAPPPQPVAEKTPVREEGIMTQDFEKAPAVKKEPEKKKPEKKPETKKPPVKTEPVKTYTKPVEKPQTVNPAAMYSNKNKGASTTESGSSEGVYKGSGNMGSPTGSTESDNYGPGLGTGSGIGFTLNGRNPVHLPKPEFNIKEEGIVVVEIAVDQQGKVVSANPGVKGSTTTNTVLCAAAKKAALLSKFNLKSDAPERQIGTITYHFKIE